MRRKKKKISFDEKVCLAGTSVSCTITTKAHGILHKGFQARLQSKNPQRSLLPGGEFLRGARTPQEYIYIYSPSLGTAILDSNQDKPCNFFDNLGQSSNCRYSGASELLLLVEDPELLAPLSLYAPT